MENGPNRGNDNTPPYRRNTPAVAYFLAILEKYIGLEYEEMRDFNYEMREGKSVFQAIADGQGLFLEKVIKPRYFQDYLGNKQIYEFRCVVKVNGDRTLDVMKKRKSPLHVGEHIQHRSSLLLRRDERRDDSKERISTSEVAYYFHRNKEKDMEVHFTCQGNELNKYCQPDVALLAFEGTTIKRRCIDLKQNFQRYLDKSPVLIALCDHLEFKVEQSNPHPSVIINDQIKEVFMRLFMVQREAVIKALTCQHIYNLYGPPGTGKTVCISYIVWAALVQNKKIIVAAETNKAVDNALDKLHEHPRFSEDIDKPGWIRRTGREEVVQENLHKYLSAPKREMSKGIFKVTTREEEIQNLKRARVIFTTLCSTFRSIFLEAFDKELFDYVVIDEASMSPIPFTLMGLTFAHRAILVGDDKQLPPVSKSQDKDLQASIYEWLFKRDELRDFHMTSMLTTQYRMHPIIARASNNHMYGDKLRPYFTNKNRTLASLKNTTVGNKTTVDGKFLKVTDILVWVENKGKESRSQEDKSYYNEDEADIVLKVIKDLMSMNVKAEDIGVITPYSSQTKKIQWVVRRLPKADHLTISTVDAFQGSEKEVIIYATTRCNSEGKQGFLQDERRMNVAVTRAKRLLVIVGCLEFFNTGHKNLINKLIDVVKEEGRIVDLNPPAALDEMEAD